MSFANVGTVWSPEMFKNYLGNIKKPSWCKAICIHHTASPSLTQRPKGFTGQHIKNIQDFYKRKDWHSGPHLFTDEDQIFGMTPLDEKGIHAASFNSVSIGIEVLGNYDIEFCDRGRGLECWKNTALTAKLLLDWLGLQPNSRTILFHRDDPKTKKSCPGTKVNKMWFIKLIEEADIKGIDTHKTTHVEETVQFVVVSDYLQNIKGYSSQEVSQKLVRDDEGLFFFNGEWLEGAYYDKTQKATIAPISELCTLPKKK